ncbi:MAG: ABC transporter permease [Spirochaeta sp.]
MTEIRTAPHKHREAWKLLPLLLPASMLAAGITHTLLLSMQPGAWHTAFQLPGLGRNLLFSLRVAAASTAISIPLGTALAYLIRRLPAVYRRRGTGFLVPLILPHVAVGFMVLLWFSQTGIAASAAAQLGLPDSFRSPLFRGDGAGIIIGYVYKSVPFVVILILPILRRIPDGYIQTARMLGAGELRCILQVILPRLRPGLAASAIIIFVYSFGAYDLPFVVGESRPRMISLYLYRLYFTGPISGRPAAAALLMLILLLGFSMVLLYALAVRRIEDQERTL